MKLRMSVVVHGRVQGVSFRHYTAVRARELGVAGWVGNLPDGTVAGEFEGDERAVRSLVEWCRTGPPAARVERLDVRLGLFSAEFSGFEIVF